MQETINTNLLDWLLEATNPSIRWFTLTRVLGKAADSPEASATREQIYQNGLVPQILEMQDEQGWWDNPESAAKPMYTTTAWQLMYLAELGASAEHPAIQKGVEFVFRTEQAEDGSFPPDVGGTYHKLVTSDMLCNDGLIAWPLLRMGVPMSDPRMMRAVGFLTDSILSGKFECRFNKNLPCAWGCAKALRVLVEVPENFCDDRVSLAIDKATSFLLEYDLSKAEYPVKPGGKISDHWFLLGFPRSYQSDILQCLVMLTDLGYARDPRLSSALDFLESKRLPGGAWPLEETIAKMPVPFEKKSKKMPSKWITWQAYYILSQAGRLSIE